jgi:hypothetical protein
MGKKPVSGKNDLASRFPEIASEWDPERNSPLSLKDVSVGSHKKVFWLCKLQHSYESDVGSRTRGRGCPYCSGNAVLAGFNDLASTRPELLAEWDYDRNFPLTPEGVSAGYDKRLYWLCSKGHSQHLVARNRHANTCPVCSGKVVLSGFNDLETIRPDIAAEWDYKKNHPITPRDRRPGSNKKAFWICQYGHPFEATINDRCRPRGSGCPFCAGSSVLEGFNDISTKNPSLAREWDWEKNVGSTPQSLSVGSRKKVYWLCPEGHSYKAWISDRQSGTGCPKCAKYGFDPTKQALFYFIENTSLNARKVGITNTNGTSDRVKRYGSGWVLVYSVLDVDGGLIRELEIQILGWIRNELGLPEFLEKSRSGLLNGFTETFSLEGPANEQIIKRIDQTILSLRSGRF